MAGSLARGEPREASTKTGRREAALVALLQHATVKDAAAACGLSEPTLFRYLQDRAFHRQLLTLRRQTFGEALEFIKGLTLEAAQTVQRNMKCGKPSIEQRAAEFVLGLGLRVHEDGELADYIAFLESQVDLLSPGWREKR